MGAPHRPRDASFFMGTLHGIAGSSHFLGVLPALALPTRAASVTYIVAFGVGTVVAMAAFAAIIGSAGSRVLKFYDSLTHNLTLGYSSPGEVVRSDPTTEAGRLH